MKNLLERPRQSLIDAPRCASALMGNGETRREHIDDNDVTELVLNEKKSDVPKLKRQP